MFSPERVVQRITIVQCGNRLPNVTSLVQDFRSADEWNSSSFVDQGVASTLLYALTHGYEYSYYLIKPQLTNVDPNLKLTHAWCRVPAMWQAIARSSADAVLYLDEDSYIDTELYLTVRNLPPNKLRAISLDAGYEQRLNVTTYLPIHELQHMFEASNSTAETTMRKHDILNTGGFWLENLTNKDSLSTEQRLFFLRAWYALGRTHATLHFNLANDQRMLNCVMANHRSFRKSTLLLEQRIYNTPFPGSCSCHLFAGFKRQEESRRRLAERLVKQIALAPPEVINALDINNHASILQAVLIA